MPGVARMVLRVVVVAALLLPYRSAGARPVFVPAFVTLAGSVPLAVQSGAARPFAPLPPARQTHLVLTLASRDPSGLAAALAAVNDPRSPAYHRYLSAATYRARFGPDPAAVAALAVWLRAHGLHTLPWQGGPLLDADGPVSQVSAAFRIRLARYRLVANGQEIDAPSTDPLLPVRFAPLVRGITGLAGQAPAVSAGRVARPSRDGPGGGYTPEQIASAYDMQPIYAAGYHGERTRVALVELAPYNQSDINAYDAKYGVAATVVNHTIPPGNLLASPHVEATMDIELLSSAVPGATIDVFSAPNDAAGTGMLDAFTQIANANLDQVMALTWVNCEPVMEQVSGFISAEHTIFEQLVLEGTTIVSATGDQGAYGCSDPTQPGPLDSVPAVVAQAGDPEVLGVGATDLILTGGASPRIAAETAWSCPSTTYPACGQFGVKGAGSGGGLSQVFHSGDSYGDDLSWQSGPGVTNSFSNGYRQVPDVSFSGSYGLDAAHQYSIYWQGNWTTGGGTSTATPMWAALILLADQMLQGQGARPLGWINRLVYQLGATTQPYPPYHDITTGNNLLYPATPGWDYATGWGSPDAWNFVRDVTGASPPATATPTGSPPSGVPSATPTGAASTAGTATPRADPTSTPTPCPTTGIGNGGFETGTLACWGVNSGLAPRVTPTMHLKGRFSIQLGALGVRQSAASVLRQNFAVPPGLAHPVLHFSYWLDTRAGRGAHPAPPILTIFGRGGRLFLHMTFQPRRLRAWSGFKVALPACTGACTSLRLEIALQVPPQPAGVSEVLYMDEVFVGT